MQYDYERAAAIINAFRDLVMEIKSIQARISVRMVLSCGIFGTESFRRL